MASLMTFDEFLLQKIFKFLATKSFISISQSCLDLCRIVNDTIFWNTCLQQNKQNTKISDHVYFFKEYYPVQRHFFQKEKNKEFIYCIIENHFAHCFIISNGLIVHYANTISHKPISKHAQKGGASVFRHRRLRVEKIYNNIMRISSFILSVRLSYCQDYGGLILASTIFSDIGSFFARHLGELNLLRFFSFGTPDKSLLHYLIENCSDIAPVLSCDILSSLFCELRNEQDVDEKWKFASEAIQAIKKQCGVSKFYIYQEYIDQYDLKDYHPMQAHIIKENGLSCVRMFKEGFGGIVCKLI